MLRMLTLGCSIAVLVVGLSGCAPATESGPPDERAPTSSARPAVPDVHERFDRVARAVMKSDSHPSGRAFAAALARAGFPDADIERTADRTAVGLPVPSVQFAVRDGGRCVIGQFGPRSTYRSEVVAPVAGRCLIGSSAPR